MDLDQIRPYHPNGSLTAAGQVRTRVAEELRAEKPRVDSEEPFDVRSFKELWRRETLTLDDLTEDRALVAWRLVRYIARVRGLCADDQFLCEAFSVEPDPWTSPVGIVAKSSITTWRLNRDVPALPLLPPDIPEAWQGQVGYLPREDEQLMEWIALGELCSRQLGIGARDVDQYACRSFFDPYLCRTSFPAPEAIYLQESEILEAALTSHLERGNGSIDDMHRKFGLTRMEAMSLLPLIGRMADARVIKNQDHNLALMCLRLESIAHRARNLMDLRAELAAMKNLAIILGLASAGTEDEIRDINSTVKELSSRRDEMLSNRISLDE